MKHQEIVCNCIIELLEERYQQFYFFANQQVIRTKVWIKCPQLFQVAISFLPSSVGKNNRHHFSACIKLFWGLELLFFIVENISGCVLDYLSLKSLTEQVWSITTTPLFNKYTKINLVEVEKLHDSLRQLYVLNRSLSRKTYDVLLLLIANDNLFGNFPSPV